MGTLSLKQQLHAWESVCETADDVWFFTRPFLSQSVKAFGVDLCALKVSMILLLQSSPERVLVFTACDPRQTAATSTTGGKKPDFLDKSLHKKTSTTQQQLPGNNHSIMMKGKISMLLIEKGTICTYSNQEQLL